MSKMSCSFCYGLYNKKRDKIHYVCMSSVCQYVCLSVFQFVVMFVANVQSLSNGEIMASQSFLSVCLFYLQVVFFLHIFQNEEFLQDYYHRFRRKIRGGKIEIIRQNLTQIQTVTRRNFDWTVLCEIMLKLSSVCRGSGSGGVLEPKPEVS